MQKRKGQKKSDQLRYYKTRGIGRTNPAKVSLSDRAIVTAGLANEVEAVNQ